MVELSALRVVNKSINPDSLRKAKEFKGIGETREVPEINLIILDSDALIEDISFASSFF